MNEIEIRPQKGFQEKFLKSKADIVIGGGAAGAGKSFAMILVPTRYVEDYEDFGMVIFRRTSVQVRNQGGLWDESNKLYNYLGATAKESTMKWIFESGATVKFSHLQYEKNKFDWQGSQIPIIGFDELTHFTKSQFFYMLSRNRSTCGVRPRVYATTNPQSSGWVKTLLSWWIDKKTGLPIPERAGVIRYFVKDDEKYIWGDSVNEVKQQAKHLFEDKALKKVDPKELIKSITFVPGSIYENEKLLNSNPQYLANLLSQDDNEKAKLLDGCWKIRNLEGLCLTNWKTYTGEFPRNAKKLGKGLDFGFSVDPTTLYQCGLFGGAIYVKKIVHETGLTTIINEKRRDQKSLEERMIDNKVSKSQRIVADSSDPQAIKDLKNCGYDVKGVKKYSGSVVAGLKILRRFTLFVHESDNEIIEELENYKLKRNSNGEYLDEPEDKFNHAIDAIRYYAMDILGKRKDAQWA